MNTKRTYIFLMSVTFSQSIGNITVTANIDACYAVPLSLELVEAARQQFADGINERYGSKLEPKHITVMNIISIDALNK